MKLSDEERKQVLEGLTHSRDNLQKVVEEARHTKMSLSLKNRDNARKFLQKIGDISFTFGAAIAPIIIVSGTKNRINYFGYMVFGLTLYLVNGFLALWKNKSLIEQDANDTAFVGIEEQIMAYPVIQSMNKLLFDLDNEEYQNEYRGTSLEATNTETVVGSKQKASFWLDLIFLFVIASALIMRPIWPWSSLYYWLFLASITLSMLSFILISYIRFIESRLKLKCKEDQLKKIKSGYAKWHQREVLKK